MTDDDFKRIEKIISSTVDKALERVRKDVLADLQAQRTETTNVLMKFNERLRRSDSHGEGARATASEATHALERIGEGMKQHVAEALRISAAATDAKLEAIARSTTTSASTAQDTLKVVRARAEREAEKSQINLQEEADKALAMVRARRFATWMRIYQMSIPLIATLLTLLAGLYTGMKSKEASVPDAARSAPRDPAR